MTKIKRTKQILNGRIFLLETSKFNFIINALNQGTKIVYVLTLLS